MKEILSINMKPFFDSENLEAKLTYIMSKNAKYERYEVWEIYDEIYNIIENYNEEDFKEKYPNSYWCYDEYSNMEDDEQIVARKINGKFIIAWDREDYEELYNDALNDYIDNDIDIDEIKDAYTEAHNDIIKLKNEPEEYDHLLDYLCNHIGGSNMGNVSALANHLAKINNMKLSKLFTIYQGNKTW